MTKLLSFLLIVFNSLCICANVNADDELAENDYSDSHTSKIGRSFIESVGRGGVIGIAAGLASEQKEKEEERQAADIEAEKEAQEIYSQTFEDFLKNNKNYSNGQVGALSEYYESGGRGPGTINMKKDKNGNYIAPKGDAGGCSYGIWQIETQKGTMQEFMKFLQNNNSEYYEQLNFDGKGVELAKNGSADFVEAWQQLANTDPEGFRQVQYEFIYAKKYEPTINYIDKMFPELDLEAHNPVVKDVIWSMSVQHGMVKKVVKDALSSQNIATMTDADIINKMYDARIYHIQHRTKMSDSDKQKQLDRYAKEKAKALEQLK